MKYPKDRFDDFPRSLNRRGAHRAPRTALSKLGSWLIALAAIVLLVAFGVGVMWMIDRQVQFTGSMAGPTESTAAPTTEAAPEPTPTPTAPEATFDGDVAVTVLNGTDYVGLATAGKELLDGDGWNVVDTADADTTNNPQTEVYVADDAQLGVAQAILDKIGTGTAIVDPSVTEKWGGGIVVIMGNDTAHLVQ